MQALREYLNTVARIMREYMREMFQVKAENCTAHLRPFMVGSQPLIHFEVCKQGENAPTATLCLSKHIVCMYVCIYRSGRDKVPKKDRIGAKIELREKFMSKHMSLIFV